MNNGSGSTITADAGPNGTTDANWSDGGLQFDGASQEATSVSAVTYGASKITVSFWAQSTNWLSGTNQVFANSNWAASGGFYIQNQNGFFEPWVVQGGGQRAEYIDTSTWTNNTWYHIVCVLDNSTSTGDIKIYVNGVEQTTTTNVSSKSGTGNFAANTLLVGAEAAGNSVLSGKIDDFRIYNSELTAGDITAIYVAGRQ
jgi:Concanavalin A-like lectin/glucanases superfamily